MKRKIFGIVCILLAILCVTSTVYALAAQRDSSSEPTIPSTTISEDYIPSETTLPETVPTEPEEIVIILDPVEVVRVESTTYEESLTLLENALAREELTHIIYEGLLTLGYAEDHPAVVMAQTDMQNAAEETKYYQEQFSIWEEKHKWEVRMERYPVATQVWLYLKNELGYSDAAAAGIIGNMMAECGGHTLELKWWLYNSSKHYGLCQWSSKYYPQMQGATLEEQLAFMKESFPKVIDEYGWLWRSGFNYEDFIAMDDCGDAAIAFCKIYERPGGTQEYRRGLAQKAYDYFTN